MGSRFVYSIVLLVLALGSSASEARNGNYENYYYRQNRGQLEAEIVYSQGAFTQISRGLANLMNGQSVHTHLHSIDAAKKISREKLVQINKIQNDMAHVIGLRAFIPPVQCVVDCDGAEAVTKKTRALTEAIWTTEWHYFDYEELGLLLAQVEGLQKLSYIAPVIRKASLLQICSFGRLSGEFLNMRIFQHQSFFVDGSDFKLVSSNKVVFRARLDLGDDWMRGECFREGDQVRISVGGLEIGTPSNLEVSNDRVVNRHWTGTYNGDGLFLR